MTLPEGNRKGQKNYLDEDDTESTPAKKLKLEITSISTEFQPKQEVCLLNFSDDVLLNICCYLRPIDLMTLSQCCTRLERIVRDRTLWTNVDFKKPLTENELKEYLKFFLPSTKTLVTYGFRDDNLQENLILARDPWLWNHFEECEKLEKTVEPEKTSLTEDFLEQLAKAAPNLKSFMSENHYIDGSKVFLDHFPSSLEELSLKNSEVFGRLSLCKSYFNGFDKCFPNIKLLDLTQCNWFTCHSFLALSKSQTLKHLILYGCPQIYDCVPYVSLGFRFGFRSLTVLDLRKTLVSDRELNCINTNTTIQELYLEAPEIEGGEVKVTDMGITMFGNELQIRGHISNMVLLLMVGQMDQKASVPAPIKKLIVRNYSLVTDTSLRHAAACLTHLNYIDVAGTGCTLDGVTTFKAKRPNVTIISNFDVPVIS